MAPDDPQSPEDISPIHPEGYPENLMREFRLKDGNPVTIRPIRPDDASRLQATFARLSPESIYLRFLQTMKELSYERAMELAYVDYRERMALVAEVEEDGDRSLIGVARYVVIGSQRPGFAECAVAVIDEYQGRGLAKVLMSSLAEYARSQGVKALTGNIHYTNARILHFIQSAGFPTERTMIDPGTWEVIIYIEEE